MLVSSIDAHQHRHADHPVHDLFVRRWSPRAMSGQPLTEDEIHRLFEAARWAPSSFNEQPWRFLYARRDTPAWPVFFDLLMDANKVWCARAGLLVLVLSRKTFSHNNKPNPVHIFDAGSAWVSLALQATEMGLVAHGMAGFDWNKARTALAVPDDFDLCAMFAVGRPGQVEDLPEPVRAREVPSGRKPIAEIAREGPFK